MDNSTNPNNVCGQQKIAAEATAQPKSKKKQKNKKNNSKSGHTTANGSPTKGGQQTPSGTAAEVDVEALKNCEIAGDALTHAAVNGISQKFKKQLHIAGNSLRQVNGLAEADQKCQSSNVKKSGSDDDNGNDDADEKSKADAAQNGHHIPTTTTTTTTSVNTVKQQEQLIESVPPKKAYDGVMDALTHTTISKSNISKNHKNEGNAIMCAAKKNNSTDKDVVVDVEGMVLVKNGHHVDNDDVSDNAGAELAVRDEARIVSLDLIGSTIGGASKSNESIGAAKRKQQQQQQQANKNTALATNANDQQTESIAAIETNTKNQTAQQTKQAKQLVKQVDDDGDDDNEQVVAEQQQQAASSKIKATTNTNTTTITTALEDESELGAVGGGNSDKANNANNANNATNNNSSTTNTDTDTTNNTAIATTPALDLSTVHIEYKEYESELQMHDIMRLIQAELSEPYSIYTYRYFIYNWPKLCFLAAHGNEYVGAIVCKLDMHMNVRRGYIAMLAVRKEYRKLKIGTTLVQKAIEAMLADNADEVVLETEMSNIPALRLYENLGFVRDKRLFRYYLNGVDALRLKLWFR